MFDTKNKIYRQTVLISQIKQMNSYLGHHNQANKEANNTEEQQE